MDNKDKIEPTPAYDPANKDKQRKATEQLQHQVMLSVQDQLMHIFANSISITLTQDPMNATKINVTFNPKTDFGAALILEMRELKENVGEIPQ